MLRLIKKNQYRNELISEIKTLAQSNGLNTVFTTFLEITATSIAAQMDPQNAEEREKRYQEMASKMTPEMLSAYGIRRWTGNGTRRLPCNAGNSVHPQNPEHA